MSYLDFMNFQLPPYLPYYAKDRVGNFRRHGPYGSLMTADYLCYCCDPPPGCPPCCIKIHDSLGRSVFNSIGDLEINDEFGNIVFQIIMPKKFSRVVCDGEIIEILAAFKEGTYPPLQNIWDWFAWNDRAWIRTEYGIVKDPPGVHVEEDRYVLFPTELPQAFAKFKYNHCWADRQQPFGEIYFGSIDPVLGEFLHIVPVECEKTNEQDCCIDEYECDYCCWLFTPLLPLNEKPEVIDGVVTYEIDGPGGWSFTIRLKNIDPVRRVVCKNDNPTSVQLEITVNPPANFHDLTSTRVFYPRICIRHPGWKSSKDHATACRPDPYVEADQCSILTRQPDFDDNLTYTVDLETIPCDDPLCPPRDPQNISIQVLGKFSDSSNEIDVSMNYLLKIEKCETEPDDLDEPCECPQLCCDNIQVVIDHPQNAAGYEIDATPRDGFLATGYVCVPASETVPNCSKHLFEIYCYPTGPDDDQVCIDLYGENNIFIDGVCGSVDQPIVYQVNDPGTGEVYTITVTCPDHVAP